MPWRCKETLKCWLLITAILLCNQVEDPRGLHAGPRLCQNHHHREREERSHPVWHARFPGQCYPRWSQLGRWVSNWPEAPTFWSVGWSIPIKIKIVVFGGTYNGTEHTYEVFLQYYNIVELPWSSSLGALILHKEQLTTKNVKIQLLNWNDITLK